MKRLVCISNGCFWNPHQRKDLNKHIKLIAKLDIDGFEFLLADALDLLTFKFKKTKLGLYYSGSRSGGTEYKEL